MGRQTPLFAAHRQSGAKIVDFGGWDMPLHYGSQLDEHHAVRRSAGMFDVSHMSVIDLHGDGVRAFLHLLLANNIDKLKSPGKALYSCMLNPAGGVVDDLIVYYFADDRFRLVVNAATADGDLEWIQQQAAGLPGLEILPRPEFGMIAVQGPDAGDKVMRVLPDAAAAVRALKPFHAIDIDSCCVARTGYTGEDGLEITLLGSGCERLWVDLVAAGVAPCGLGARDTLRLEAGMNLYGSDMDESTNPLESGLGWTIGWEPQQRAFIGRRALQAQREQGIERQMVGLVLEDRGVLRNHQPVVFESGRGEITSGSFSPTLSKSIALARVPAAVTTGDECQVEVRNKSLAARVVDYPFVRNGKSCLP